MGAVANPIKYTSSEEDEALAEATYLRCSDILNKVLNAAVELSLFDLIAQASGADGGASVSAAEVASQLPTKNPNAANLVDRMLRVLSCHSLLKCSLKHHENGSVERLYRLTPVGNAFVLNRPDGKSLATFRAHKATEMIWFHLKDLVLEGGDLFEKVHGMPIYEYMSTDPEMGENFDKGMASLSRITMSSVLEVYRGFEGLKALVDVGGGTGETLHMIISKYPSIKGINFDTPHVIQHAHTYPGIEYVGGDMFASIPKADCIMMKNILHNWNDEMCLKILKNCYDVLPEKGKAIVLSWIIPEAPDSSIPNKYMSHMDVVMFVHGGRQRTESEFKALSEAAGFSDFKVNTYAYYVAVMELFK